VVVRRCDEDEDVTGVVIQALVIAVGLLLTANSAIVQTEVLENLMVIGDGKIWTSSSVSLYLSRPGGNNINSPSL
jgi:hypothetical protein